MNFRNNCRFESIKASHLISHFVCNMHLSQRHPPPQALETGLLKEDLKLKQWVTLQDGTNSWGGHAVVLASFCQCTIILK